MQEIAATLTNVVSIVRIALSSSDDLRESSAALQGCRHACRPEGLHYDYDNADANCRRNSPTSVTMPMVCDDPRSASLVTTAGLMSTETIFTHDGSMFPTPMP